MHRLIYVFALIHLLPLTLHAQLQYPTINKLKIMPSQPDGCDSIDVVVEGMVNNTSINVSSSSANVSGSQTDVVVYFESQGIGNPTIVPYSETVQVGLLPSGVNDLHTEARYQGSVTDTKDTTFTVQNCCADFSQLALSTDTACTGDTITASKTNVAGMDISWIVDSVELDSMQPTIPLTFTDTGRHIVTLITSVSNCADTARDTLMVHPKPDSASTRFNLSQSQICENDTVIANKTGIDTNDFKWLVNGTLRDSMNSSLPLSFSDTGEQYISVIASNGVCSDTASDSVTVYPKPDSTSIVRNNNELVAPPATSYQWFRNGQKLTGEESRRLPLEQSGNYSVSLTNQFGCTAKSESFQVNLNNLAKRATGSLTIYPQPALDFMVVNWPNGTSHPQKISIYNADGRVIYKEQQFTSKQQFEIELDGVPSGLYFLMVETEEKVFHRKLMVR